MASQTTRRPFLRIRSNKLVRSLATFTCILLVACGTASEISSAQSPTTSPTGSATSATATVSAPPPTSTLELAITPTLTVTPKPTLRAELSWPRAFDLLVNMTSERATLGPDGVTVDNRGFADYNGMDSKPIPLSGPVALALRFDYQGNGYGSLNVTGQLSSNNPWWKGLIRLWVISEKGRIYLNVYDGTSEQRVGYFPIRSLQPTSLFYLLFPDPHGKQVLILNDQGALLQEVDFTKVGQGPLSNGLFPEQKMYAGFVITPDSHMQISEFSLLAPPTSNLFQIYEQQDLPTPPLRELARQRGITFGVEIDLANMEFYYDSRYQPIVAREFDAVTSGYGTSWAWAIHADSPAFNWTKADLVANFVRKAGLKLSWDCLVFATQPIPDWIANGGYSRDQILGVLENHVRTVVPRYQDVVTDWGVVSEADWSGPTPGGTFTGFPDPNPPTLLGQFLDVKVGPEPYIERVFRATRQADPRGVLTYINDKNETINARSDFEFRFLSQMKQKGMPIDAIGFEMNLQASDFKSDADIQAWKKSVIDNMRRFGGLGLQVIIKELTVNVGNVEGKTREEKWALQAKIYKAAIESCLESGGVCTRIYIGGLTDTTSWLYYPGYPYGKAEAPNMLDENYRPKPAYFAIRDALLGK